MSDQKHDETHDENVHQGDVKVDPEQSDSATTPTSTDSAASEDSDGLHEDDAAQSLDAAEIPRFARLSGWFGFLLPPVGAIMGHIWLAWEGKDKDVPGRRHAVVGIIVGWFLTFVLGVAALVGATLWFEASEEARIQESREQITQEELATVLSAAEDSPATGVIDAATCDGIFSVVNPETPPEDLAQLVGSYEGLAAGETPNADAYADYADYLREFDSAEDFEDLDEAGVAERTENAEMVLEALDEDSLGCVALDENYFLDNVADRNTREF